MIGLWLFFFATVYAQSQSECLIYTTCTYGRHTGILYGLNLVEMAILNFVHNFYKLYKIHLHRTTHKETINHVTLVIKKKSSRLKFNLNQFLDHIFLVFQD